jgi:hypothetical protein
MGKSDMNCVKRGNRKDFKILGRQYSRAGVSFVENIEEMHDLTRKSFEEMH